MINLETKEIIHGDLKAGIMRFEVWWRGPQGLYKTLDDALKMCKDNDFEPGLVLRPVCMSIGKDNVLEEMT